MQEGEVSDISKGHPLMGVVLKMIESGEKIEKDGPFYSTYLLARQRGFVERVGADKETIAVSARGNEFLTRKANF